MTTFETDNLLKLIDREEFKYLKSLPLPQALKIIFGASKIECAFFGAQLIEIKILKPYEEVIKNEQ